MTKEEAKYLSEVLKTYNRRLIDYEIYNNSRF